MRVPNTTEALPVVRPPSDDKSAALVLIYSRLHPDLPGAFVLGDYSVVIGREARAGIVLAEGAVSRSHAEIVPTPQGRHELVDLGSTNGTFVNGIRVNRSVLEPHDVVRVGDTVFRYAARDGHAFASLRIADGVAVDEYASDRSVMVGGLQIERLRDSLLRVALSGLRVVVHGESGSGKELIAREVHATSGRTGAFLGINCAALPSTLVESELFGHKRGAFTGAATDKTGLIRAAHKGTLFLDEIGDLPLDAQAKLLRVLQEREVLPIGATAAEKVDVRFICATHRDLESLVADGRFRGDLFARLREFTVSVPPLRERREDLYRLVSHFLRLGSTEMDERVDPGFFFALAHYSWPYNVRELDSAVRHALTLAGDSILTANHLPAAVARAADPVPFLAPGTVTNPRRDTYVGFQKENAQQVSAPEDASLGPREVPTAHALRDALVRHNGNVAAVGRELGRERMQVHRWMKRYGFNPDDFR